MVKLQEIYQPYLQTVQYLQHTTVFEDCCSFIYSKCQPKQCQPKQRGLSFFN